MIFRELISNEEDDLRVNIASIEKKDGLDKFLREDDRLCVVLFHATFCKACKGFRKQFRKLATERGDAVNAIGDTVRIGDARFGEIEYSSNTKLVKELGISKFPTVAIFRGGETNEMISEITCKKDAIEVITARMDNDLSVR
jgi:thiol-disulfide isomerase/thioredoxin